MTQSNPDVSNAFNSALEANKKQRKGREEQRTGGGTGGTWEIITWCGLEDKVEKVVRIYGLPIEVRKVGTDPKLIYHSKLLNDKKEGYQNVVWPSKNDGLIDENWILHQLYSYVMRKEWRKYADGHTNDKGYDGEYSFIYENTETYKRLKINLKKNASPKFYPPSSKPKARVLFNVIDRHDTWCKDNKHSKILTSKNSYWKDDEEGNPIYFPDMGVPEMVYSRIMDEIVAYRGHWNLDVVIRKNSSDMNNAYIIKDILDEKIYEESKKIGNSDPLTEELQYELYDFDTMKTFRVTPYRTIRKNLIGLFKMADAEFNESFTEKLERLAEQEEKESPSNDSNDVEDSPSVKQEQENPQESIVVQEPVEQPVVQQRRGAQEGAISFSIMFPAWDSLKEVERTQMKEKITSIKSGTKYVPVYVDPSDVLPCVDANCKFLESEEKTVFPSTVFTCPICGKVDESQ